MLNLSAVNDNKDIATKEYVDGKAAVTGVKGNSESSYRTGQVNLTAANIGAAPTAHATTATTYGIGTGSNYGHVKLSDSTSTTSGASAGIAATPTAVKAAYDLANGKRSNTAPTSGTWFAGTPLIGSDGVMEVGKYIDFHSTSAGTTDFDARITASTTGLTLSGTTSGEFAGEFTSGYARCHAENSPTLLIPFINNDIAHLTKRGGSVTATYDGTVQSGLDFSALFDGSGAYFSLPTGSTPTTAVFELTLHRTFTYTTNVYIDFGNPNWRAQSVKIEKYTESTWTTIHETTSNNKSYVCVSHSTGSSAISKLRFTLSNWANTQKRIAQIGVYYYGSAGTREPYMSRGVDDYVFRNITPNANNTYALGSSSNKWSSVYANTFIGALSGNATTATTATNMSGAAAASNTSARHVWFSDSATETKRAYSDSLTYVSSTNTISANISGNAATATSATSATTATNATNAANADKVNNLTVQTAVPANAVFTDTKNTAGSTNSTSKLFLIGATTNGSSATNPQTYSNSNVYATNGALQATTYNGLTLTKASTGFTIAGGTTSKTLTVNNTYTLAAACAKGVDTSMTSTSTSTNLPTTKAVVDYVNSQSSVTGADYITEQGTSNGWVYRKWNSGIAECWGNFSHSSVSISSKSGNAWYSGEIYETFPSSLFNASPSYCDVSANPNAGVSFEVASGLSSTRTQAIYLMRLEGSATVSVWLQIHAIGTWK